MKATRKLIPALAMLLVAAVVMSSASYAWFTMSRQVTAQGMNVTVTAPNNLLIMATGTSDAFAEISTINGQNIILMPASSNTGKKNDIYVVKDGQPLNATNGSLFMTDPNGKQTLLEEAKLAVGAASSADAKAGGYYDFKYTIKTEGNSAVNVVVSQITVTKKNNDPQGKLSVKPVRIAVMSVSGEDESMVKVYKPDSTAVNHDNKVVDSISVGVPTLVADTGIYTAVATKNNDANYVAQLSAGGTQDIIIRVWYEGQDTDCVVSKGANVNFDIEVVLADVASLPNA
ncbi:MAG: hypothetical protein PUC05_01455 [Firmicutes bacterium]|nr:hypothetical protein [Bacillota bacterium]